MYCFVGMGISLNERVKSTEYGIRVGVGSGEFHMNANGRNTKRNLIFNYLFFFSTDHF